MFVWRKRVSTVWLAANEAALREVAGRQLAIISRPDRTTAIAEIAGSSRRDLEKIRSRFGGAIEKLLRDWLTKFSKAHAIKPIRIGKRLIIYRSVTSKNRSRNTNKSLLISAGTGFWDGGQTTTALAVCLFARGYPSRGARGGAGPPHPKYALLD